MIYANANQDPAKQQQQAEAAITQGAKVIVISAVDVKSAAGIVQRAKQSDVPVITYGRLIPDADIDYYVSIDPFKVGQQQAEAQLDALKKAGGSTPEGGDDQRRADRQQRQALQGRAPRTSWRSRGREVVKSSTRPTGARTRPSRRWSSPSPRSARTASTRVYVANDGMAGGAIAALKGARHRPRPAASSPARTPSWRASSASSPASS